MKGCIYRTKDNECDLYSEGGKYSAFCVLIDGVKDCVGRKMSNADRIRSMTDEELAEHVLVIKATKDYCSGDCNCLVQKDKTCYKCRLEWLRKEAE